MMAPKLLTSHLHIPTRRLAEQSLIQVLTPTRNSELTQLVIEPRKAHQINGFTSMTQQIQIAKQLVGLR